MNNIRGKRGNKAHKSSFENGKLVVRAPFKSRHSTSTLAQDAGKYYECFDRVEIEGEEKKVIDRSLTMTQHLRIFDKVTLLRKGLPDQQQNLKRQTSRRKIVKWDEDATFRAPK